MTPRPGTSAARRSPIRALRTMLFWMHLTTGVTIGTIVFVMSVTGALMAYQRQIQHWADVHAYASAPPSDAARLPMSAIVAAAAQAAPDAPPATVTWRRDPAEPVAVTAGTRTLYVNPYDGHVYGEGGGARWRAFFTTVNGIHRWLGMADARRNTGRDIVAACNLGFLFLVLSGFYLWWPRSWTWTQFRQLLWFRRGLSSPKARYFNWHHVIGIWSAIPLVLIVSSGVVMSYPWANALVYRAFGEAPPPAGRGGGAGGDDRDAGPGGPGGGRGRGGRGGARIESLSGDAPVARDAAGRRRDAGSPDGDRRARPEAAGGARADAEPHAGPNLDALATRAESYEPNWRILTLRLPARSGPATITIDRGDGGQPALRDTLTLDSRTGDVVRWEPFAGQTPGRRARSWLRFIHTGEAFGLVGETIAAVVSSGVAVLVFSGISLAIRRVFGRSARRRANAA